VRQLIILPTAEKSISEVADWLASEYFLDTGLKFIEEVEVLLLDYAKLSNLVFPLCRNKKLARRKFSCIIFKRKWVVAFKYSKDKFVVHEFLWGGKLK
jgi:hypothetical protein